MFAKYNFKKYDVLLVLLTIAISVLGIQFIGSAKEELVARQTQGLILGVTLMLIISLIDYQFILKFYWLLYIASLALLIFVKLFGDSGGGASRWFEIGGLRFQPSEIVKILLILFYAQFIMKHRETINTIRMLFACTVLIVPPFVLIYMQPDLSTSIMILIIFAVVMFVGGLSYKIVIGFIVIMVPAAVIFLNMVLQPDQKILNEYQQLRILAWLQPEKYATTIAYQTMNGITAIGSGQLTGKGLNNNVIASVKNGNFISAAQTDFIFAVVGEELGFVGCCAVIGLLFLIVLECILIARKAKDLAGSVIAAGMAGLIGFQTFINIGVVTAILPNTGLTLPFVSYGLTSLVSLFIGIGFVLNVKLQTSRYM
ncbi:MAG TPA: FtsW/RodA/SpoVE family cell cycle protein [Lachnospiraceae bacterium]|nr:FtsW/RodA/SpoVE family cell cycle protein [Lachnospiraceae bacterium]